MLTPWSYAESNTEHSHQVALFMWANILVAGKFPNTARLKWMHAIPNGGSRGDNELSRMIRGGQLKAEGVKKGVSDISLPCANTNLGPPPHQYHHGLYIELKRIKSTNKRSGKASTEQDEFQAFVKDEGFKAVVCIGWLEAKKVVCQYLDIDEVEADAYVLREATKSKER